MNRHSSASKGRVFQIQGLPTVPFDFHLFLIFTGKRMKKNLQTIWVRRGSHDIGNCKEIIYSSLCIALRSVMKNKINFVCECQEILEG